MSTNTINELCILLECDVSDIMKLRAETRVERPATGTVRDFSVKRQTPAFIESGGGSFDLTVQRISYTDLTVRFCSSSSTLREVCTVTR